MGIEKKTFSIFKKISGWATRNVWPWSELARLRDRLWFVQSQLDAHVGNEVQNKAKWMATANSLWGPNPFTGSELIVMEHCYGRGFGWSDALNELRKYRTAIPRNFEVKR